MSAEVELRAALAELVACKDLKDEEQRLRQRRECSIRRDPEALARVNAMRDEYNFRAPRAWARARALVGKVSELEHPSAGQGTSEQAEWREKQNKLRKTLQFHGLTKHGDGVVEADIMAIFEAQAAGEADPCPGCRKGAVCRTPACGRLALPIDHPLRKAAS